MFAIQQGAKFIYDTDDDNEPLSSLENYFDFDDFKQELEYDLNSPLIINPYACNSHLLGLKIRFNF